MGRVTGRFEGVAGSVTCHFDATEPKDNRRPPDVAGGNGNDVARALPHGPPAGDVEYDWLHCCPKFFRTIVRAGGAGGTEPSTVPRNLVLGTKDGNAYMNLFEASIANAVQNCKTHNDWTIVAEPNRHGEHAFLANKIEWSLSTPVKSPCFQQEFIPLLVGRGKEQIKLYEQIMNACCHAEPSQKSEGKGDDDAL